MNDFTWRTSSYSSRVNCVEVAVAPDRTAIRDSKAPESGRLVVDRTTWGTFLGRLKEGRYDYDLR